MGCRIAVWAGGTAGECDVTYMGARACGRADKWGPGLPIDPASPPSTKKTATAHHHDDRNDLHLDSVVQTLQVRHDIIVRNYWPPDLWRQRDLTFVRATRASCMRYRWYLPLVTERPSNKGRYLWYLPLLCDCD